MVIHIIPSYPQGLGTPQKKGKGIVGVQQRELLHTVSLERDRNTALKAHSPCGGLNKTCTRSSWSKLAWMGKGVRNPTPS